MPRRPDLVGPRPRVAENFGLVQREYPAIAHQDAAVHDGRADIAAARHVHEMGYRIIHGRLSRAGHVDQNDVGPLPWFQ
jgi:hypothetical protein